MILKNFFGTSFDFTPKAKERYNNYDVGAVTNVSALGNNIYLMSGPMPSSNVLYEIEDEGAFKALYADNFVAEFLNQKIDFTYNVDKKEKIMRKLPDALDFVYAMDATITWFAVKMRDVTGTKITFAGMPIEASSTVGGNTSDRLVDGVLNNYWYADAIVSKELIFDFNTVDTTNTILNCINLDYQNYRDQKMVVEGSINKTDWTLLGTFESTTDGDYYTDTDMVDFNYIKLTFSTDAPTYILINEITLYGVDTTQPMIFSDSIGVWEDEQKIITLDNINGNQGSANILKDFTLVLRDTCDLERAGLPVNEYQIDNNPGIINVDPISEGYITNTERTQPLVVSGNTIDIEDGQIVTVSLNNIDYTTTLSNNLWSLTIDDISGLENDTSYNVDVSVRDVAGNLSTASQTLVIAGTNAGPVITVVDSLTLNEDDSSTVQITVMDTNETVASTNASATNGTIVWDTDAETLTYTPNENYNGSDTIVLTAVDSLGAETIKEIPVTITPINDLPTLTLASNSLVINEDEPGTVSVVISDVEGVDTVDVIAENGIVSYDSTNSEINYIPNENYNGSDTITITVTDTNAATVSDTISVSIVAVNDNTIVIEDAITTIEDTEVTIDVIVNDTDIDGNIATLVSVTDGSNGTTSILNDKVVYTPNLNFNGTDSFTYTNSEGSVGVVTVTVTAVNDAPIISLVSDITVDTDSLTDINYSVNDVDNDALTISATTSGDGSVSINTTTNTISYDAQSVAGTDVISLSVNDGTVTEINTINVTIVAGA